MSINLYDVNSLDPKTIHTLHELQSLMKSLGPERLSDLVMTVTTSQLMTEINLLVTTDINTPKDFWLEITGRLLLLMKEQESSGKFIDNRH